MRSPLLPLVALLLAAAGCGGGTGGGSPAATEGPRTRPLSVITARAADAADPVPSWQRPGLVAVMRTLRKQLGGDPRIYMIAAYPRYVVVVVQDPRIRRNLDRYDWQDGEFRGPEPYGARDEADLRWQAFPLSGVRLGAVPRLVRRAEAVPLEGGTTGYVTVTGAMRGPVIAVHRSGLREGVRLLADGATGRVREIDRG